MIIVLGESKLESDSDGVARSHAYSRKKKTPYLEKRIFVRLGTRLMPSDSSCMQCHALRYKTHSLIVAGTPADQTVRLHMPIGPNLAPIGTFGENSSHLEKSGLLLEKKILIMISN